MLLSQDARFLVASWVSDVTVAFLVVVVVVTFECIELEDAIVEHSLGRGQRAAVFNRLQILPPSHYDILSPWPKWES